MLKRIKAVDKPIEAANGLPNECYTSRGLFRATSEGENFFVISGLLVGVGSSIPNPGDAKPYNLLGIPLISN